MYICNPIRVLSDFTEALLTRFFNIPYRMPAKAFPMYKEFSKDAVGGADMPVQRRSG